MDNFDIKAITYSRSENIILIFQPLNFLGILLSESRIEMDRVHIDRTDQSLKYHLIPFVITLPDQLE